MVVPTRGLRHALLEEVPLELIDQPEEVIEVLDAAGGWIVRTHDPVPPTRGPGRSRISGLASSYPASPSGELPKVSYRRVAPYEFRVRVEGARRPFLLAVGETFARGWRVEAAGRELSGLAHVRVNGYANGWRLPRGTYELTITYGPERLARSAVRFDLILIPLVALLWLGRAVARRPHVRT